MKKGMKVLFVGLLVFLGCITVNAKGKVYYVNENGVELDQYEYVFLQNFYFDTFPEHITQEQYNTLIENDFFNGTVSRVTSSDEGTKSDFHVTNAKTLTISKSCGQTCTVALQADWTYDPAVRSYDDIGFYFLGSSMSYHAFTVSSSTSYYQTFNNIISNSSGFGNTVALAPTGSNVTVASTLIMNTGGHVYGSYQHAMQSIPFSTAQDYIFSLLQPALRPLPSPDQL